MMQFQLNETQDILKITFGEGQTVLLCRDAVLKLAAKLEHYGYEMSVLGRLAAHDD